MNKETLEEAAKHYQLNDNKIHHNIQYRAFRTGAKWMQERMYSEEDLREAFKQSRQAKIFEKNMPPVYENFQQWFDQFKKKQSGE